MSVTRIEGTVILLAGTQLLADEAAAKAVIQRSGTGPTTWSIRNIRSPVDFDEVIPMLKGEQVMHFSFTPSNGEQSFMGAGRAIKVDALEDGCSIEVYGWGTLHSFNPNDLC